MPDESAIGKVETALPNLRILRILISKQVDPDVVSALLITTLVDATGLIIYFTIAKMILHA